MHNTRHLGKRKSNTNIIPNNNKKIKTNHANEKFIECAQRLVVCNFYLSMLYFNINEHNSEEVKKILERQDYQYPVVIKSGDEFWVYKSSTDNNKQKSYFSCITVDNEDAFYLATLFNQYNDLLAAGNMVVINTATLGVCRISNTVYAETNGEVKLTELKPIEDGCYYSLCLVNIFNADLLAIFRKNDKTAKDRKDIYNYLLNYAFDERKYPNTIVIRLGYGSFWLYYNKFNDPYDFILQEIATKPEDKERLHNFFAKHEVTLDYKGKLITELDNDSKEIDIIIKHYVSQYNIAKWLYYGKKGEGYTDGCLLKAYDSDDIYLCKARLHSYDFSCMEVADFESDGIQDGKAEQLKDKFPVLIKDQKSNGFIFCYLYDYELVPVIDFSEIPNDNQIVVGKIYISINKKTRKLAYTIRKPNGDILRDQVLENIVFKSKDELNKGLLEELNLKILKSVAEKGNTYQGTQALAIIKFKSTVSEDLSNDKVRKEDLACLEALFQAFKIKQSGGITSLIAMDVNRKEIAVDGKGIISGNEIYKILERRFGYSRPYNEYKWYFYESFCESTGSELFRYILEDLAPINQLISIPGEAPGLVSKYFSGGFSNLEILRHYLVQYDSELKSCEESEEFINKLLAEKFKGYNMKTLTPEQKKVLLKQYILGQDNTGMIIAVNCFLSDIDGKFANMGMTLKDGRISIARVDFGTTFAKLYNHLHAMKVYLLGVDEEVDGISYEQNNNYDKIYGALLYEEKFRVALLGISRLDLGHLSMLIELATARFLQAWHGRAISEASVIKLCTHLFGHDETKWPKNARYYFVDENNIVRFNDQSVKQITGTITRSLKDKQTFFKKLNDILKHAKLFKIFANLSKSINASMGNIKVFDIENILIYLSGNESDRVNLKNIAQYKIEDIKEAINLIEAERKNTIAPEQAAFIGKIASSHYWKVLAFFICSLRYEESTEEMWKKYRFLLEKLNSYPAMSSNFKEKLLNFSVEMVCYNIMIATKKSNSYPCIIYPAKYFLLGDKLIQETTVHNKNSKIDLSKNYRTYYWTTAYVCFAGQKVIPQINEVVRKEEKVALPIDEHEEAAYSVALARGLEVSDFRIKVLDMEDDKLIMEDYSTFVDFVNTLTEIKLSVSDIIKDFDSVSSVIMQFSIAAANSNISKLDTLMETLRYKYFENSISYEVFLNTRLLALHVAIIKNQKDTVAHLISDFDNGYFFPFNQTLGRDCMPCTALQRALVMHNTGIVEILLKKLIEQNMPFEIIDFIYGDRRDFYMGLDPVINDDINHLENLDRLFIELYEGASKTILSPASKKTLLKTLVFYSELKRKYKQPVQEKILKILNESKSSYNSKITVIKSLSYIDGLICEHMRYTAKNDILTMAIQSKNYKLIARIVQKEGIKSRKHMELLKNIANNDKQSQSTLLHEVARTGNNRALAELLKYKIINNFSPKDAKGQTPLLVAMKHGYQDIVATLIEAMFYHDCETLVQAFEDNKHMLDILIPNTRTVTQYGLGPNILWFLVNAISKYYSPKIIKYINALSNDFLQLIDFNIAPNSGLERDTTLLWLLAAAEIKNKKITWLRGLFNKAKTAIANSNLNASPKQGAFKDISVLYILTEQVARSSTENNNSMLDMIINELYRTSEFTKLRKLDLNVRDKEGRTAFWNLTLAFQKGYSDAIVSILKVADLSFVRKLKLNICPIDSADEGITPLWLLTNAAHCGKPEALQELVPKIISIKARDLNHAPRNSAHQYVDATVAWLLSDMAVNGIPELFEKFFEKLPNKEILKLKLNAKPAHDPHANTLLANILKLALCGRPAGLNKILLVSEAVNLRWSQHVIQSFVNKSCSDMFSYKVDSMLNALYAAIRSNDTKKMQQILNKDYDEDDKKIIISILAYLTSKGSHIIWILIRSLHIDNYTDLIMVIVENILRHCAHRIEELYALSVTLAQYGYYEPLISFYLRIDNSIIANLDNSGQVEAELVARVVPKMDYICTANAGAINYVTDIIKQHFEQQRSGYILYDNGGGQEAIELKDIKSEPSIDCTRYTPQFNLWGNNAASTLSLPEENKQNINPLSISWQGF